MKVERFPAPTAGINYEASPDYVAPTEAADLVNWLPGAKGKLRMRGPIVESGDVGASWTDGPLLGFWANGNIGLATPYDSGTNTIGSTFAVFPGGSGNAMTVTDVTTASSVVVGADTFRPLSTMFAAYSVRPSHNFRTVGAMVNPASGNAIALGEWDQVATFAVLTAAPTSFVDVAAHTQRVFILGGESSDLGFTPSVQDPDTVLWFTRPGSEDLNLAANWTDESSGLVNQIRYDADDESVGLARCGRWLAILGTRSVNIMLGDGPTNYTIRNLSRDIGCVSRETIVEADDGFFFMSERGLYFCDGSSLVPISHDRLASHWIGGQQEMQWHTATPTRLTMALFSNGWLAYNCLGAPHTGNGLLLGHIGTQAWTTIASDLFHGGTVKGVYRVADYPLIWDGGTLFTANRITDPSSLAFTQGDVDSTGTAKRMSGQWKSRIARLGSPSLMARLRRVLLDYQHAVQDPGTSGLASVVSLSVRDDRNNSLASEDVETEAGGGVHRKRAQYETFAETDSAQIVVAHDGVFLPPFAGPTDIYAIELYDAWVEYDPAQDRRTF